jgi:DNA-binding response OmpR family regulator
MPRLSGINMLKKIRQTPGLETVGVILLTVLNDTKDRIRGYDHFADLYFTKPFDTEELLSATIGLVMMRQQMRRIYSGEKAIEFQAKHRQLNEDDEAFLQKLSDVVEKHISEYDISIDTIALATDSTVEELEKHLEELEGISPSEYFLQVKLEHSKQLAEAGKAYSLNDLATQVGFRDPDLFLKEFKDHFGFLPQLSIAD